MKATFLFCLIATAACIELSTYHYKDGSMSVNGAKAGKIDGPIFMEFLNNQNVTIIAGMYSAKTPFFFAAKIISYKVSGGKYVANATCLEAAWGTTALKALNGTIIVTGVVNSTAIFKGVCATTKGTINNYSMSAQGTYAKNVYYTPLEAAKRAPILVGHKTYKAPHVLNFAIYGYPFLSQSMNCAWYLKNFKNATEAKAGYVVVGTDGKHCGIIDAEADKFVHVNPTTKIVIMSTMSSLHQFFPKGYQLKSY